MQIVIIEPKLQAKWRNRVKTSKFSATIAVLCRQKYWESAISMQYGYYHNFVEKYC